MQNSRRLTLLATATAVCLACPGVALAADSNRATAITAGETASAGQASSNTGQASAAPLTVAGTSVAGGDQLAPGTTQGAAGTIGAPSTAQIQVAPWQTAVASDGAASSHSSALSVMSLMLGVQAEVLSSSSQTTAQGENKSSSDAAAVRLTHSGWIHLFHTGSDGDTYVINVGTTRYRVTGGRCAVAASSVAGLSCIDGQSRLDAPVGNSSAPGTGGGVVNPAAVVAGPASLAVAAAATTANGSIGTVRTTRAHRTPLAGRIVRQAAMAAVAGPVADALASSPASATAKAFAFGGLVMLLCVALAFRQTWLKHQR